MESLNLALELIKKDCYIASVDLKDAFYSLPVSIEHTDFLKFEHQGKSTDNAHSQQMFTAIKAQRDKMHPLV